MLKEQEDCFIERNSRMNLMLQKYKIPMILILSITMIILSGCGSKESVTEVPSVSESSLEKETISAIPACA